MEKFRLHLSLSSPGDTDNCSYSPTPSIWVFDVVETVNDRDVFLPLLLFDHVVSTQDGKPATVTCQNAGKILKCWWQISNHQLWVAGEFQPVSLSVARRCLSEVNFLVHS